MKKGSKGKESERSKRKKLAGMTRLGRFWWAFFDFFLIEMRRNVSAKI